MQWTGECIEQEHRQEQEREAEGEGEREVKSEPWNCLPQKLQLCWELERQRQQSAQQVQERETIYGAHATPTGQSTQKAKDNLLDASASVSAATEGLRREAKQILAAWLIANSSQSWLQIKQTVRRAKGVCYMLIIFNWFIGKECQRCSARFSVRFFVRFSVESAATAVASWSCLTLSRGKF